MNDHIMACQGLTKQFVDGDTTTSVLHGIDFEIAANETVAIVGASGAGKSTLLHLLGGLEQPSQGEVFWNNQDINTLSEKTRCQLRNQHLGFVYQFHHLLPEFNAWENVAMPLLIAKHDAKNAEDAAKSLLSKVGLSHRLNHKVTTLSGGERQRVAIARSIANNPKCLLADEPTGNLDQVTANKVFDLLFSLQADLGISFIIVTHDHALAQRADKRYHLVDGVMAVDA